MSGHDPLYGLSDADGSRYAAELEANPIWNHILIELDEQAVDTWRHSKNTAAREACWFEMLALQGLRHRIQGRIDNVKIEAASRAARRRADAA